MQEVTDELVELKEKYEGAVHPEEVVAIYGFIAKIDNMGKLSSQF